MKRSDLPGPFLLLLLLSTPAVPGLGSVLWKRYEYHRNNHYSWDDARHICRTTYNWDLAITYSKTDLDDVNIEDYYAWIGLFRAKTVSNSWNHWLWSNKDGTRFRAWASHEPDWGDGCAYVASDIVSSVYGSTCNKSFFFICHEPHKDHYNYTFVPESKTWSEARAYCKHVYTDLSTFKTSRDLEKGVRPQGFPVWTGLRRDEGAWTWTRGLSGYRDWAIGEPSNAGDCVSISSEDKLMSTRNCSARFPFLCYGDNLVLVKENKTWEEALEHCRALRGGGRSHELLSVEPRQDQSYMMRRVMEANTDEVWTGLRFLAGSWFWVDRAVLSHSGLPVCPQEQQHCGTLSKYNESSIKTRNCSETRNFLCYFK